MASQSVSPAPTGEAKIRKPSSEAVHGHVYFRAALLLGFILSLSIGARIWWVKYKVTEIEGEGANYARMAENISLGKGWLGMQGHLQLFYPPLFPLLVAKTYPLVHDAEIAGRLVSILFGSLLIFPIFFLARELYGERAGYLAALCVALHPVLVGISAGVYSESTYLFFLFLAFYLGIRAARKQDFKWAIASGTSVGLAYLARSEALLAACFLAGLVLVLGYKNRFKAILVAACLVAACGVLAAPYVWFLKSETGQFRLEAKSSDNFTYGKMRLAGVPWEQAFRQIDDNLQPVGLAMRTDLDVLKTTRFSLPVTLRFVKLAAHDNGRYLVHDLLEETASGGFVLLGLIAIGLFASPWNLSRALQEAAIILFLMLLFLPLLTLVTYWNTRYVLAFLLIAIIWAANGAVALSEWCGETLVRIRTGRPLKEFGQIFVATFAVLAMLLVAWSGISHVENLRSGDPALKAAGLYIKEWLASGEVVMDTDNLIAYYSGGAYRPVPYASESTALRYIDAEKVRVLVIREQNAETSNPYYAGWISKGIPDPAFSLVGSIPSQEYGRILIYRRR
ncbi:MAG TPA: glycosyltransferase family 39 protein [Candidatus Aquilonibacter sp.]|nr:glycosyltransferase family 39 protein [Candidatus Aquilonibacter sp.]